MVGGQEHGHLGLQASWEELEGGGVYKVDAVLKGDVWDSAFSGPLARSGVLGQGYALASCLINRMGLKLFSC